MSLEANKLLARRALGMWASDSTDSPEEIFAADYLNHQEPDVAGGVSAKPLKVWKQLVGDYHEAFSDSKVEILIQIAEGNHVATRWRFTATHTGPYSGLQATGKTCVWTGVEIDRIENGRIAESWVDWDKFRLFEELGIVK